MDNVVEEKTGHQTGVGSRQDAELTAKKLLEIFKEQQDDLKKGIALDYLHYKHFKNNMQWFVAQLRLNMQEIKKITTENADLQGHLGVIAGYLDLVEANLKRLESVTRSTDDTWLQCCLGR